MTMVKKLLKQEDGQDLIEYALLVALIALAVAAAFPPVGTAIAAVYTRAQTCMSGGAC